MKLHLLNIPLFAAVFLCIAGQPLAAQPAPQLVPEGREAIGYGLLPFASIADAQAGDIAKSPYIQPLGGAWKVKSVAGRNDITAAMASDQGWSEVQLPQKNAATGNIVLLRREFKRPFAWDDRQIFIRLQGVGAPYELFVNAKICGSNPSPRVGADFDVTNATVEGYNTLTLVLCNDFPPAFNLAARPQAIVEGDIYAFSQPKMRVRDIDAGATVSDGNGLLNLGVIVKSHLLNPREVEIFYELDDPQGKAVASSHRPVTLSMRQEDTVRFFANIPNVKPWSAETPTLYTLQIKTQYEGRYGEYVAVKIGFRDVKVEKGKFFVNGVETPLTAAVVAPVNDLAAAEAKLREVKKQGANIVRLSGGPASADFYALCDRIGIYVCAQAALNAAAEGKLNSANNPALEELFRDRVTAMYNASKNHPSVVMFSLAEGAANGFNLYQAYLDLRKIERTRPISFTGAGNEWNSDTSPDGSFRSE